MSKPLYKSRRNYENLNKVIYKGSGIYNIPQILPVNVNRANWIGFNYAKTCIGIDPADCGIHFFIDDYQFIRLWTHPDQYINMLHKFKMLCTPDFSTYTDFPVAVQIYNHYRKHWLGAYWQSHGMTVVPTISWSDHSSYKWCFDGEPVAGCVAVSSVGTQLNSTASALFLDGFSEMVKRLRPLRIFFYGSVPPQCYDFGIDIANVEAYQQKWRQDYA